MKLVIDGIEFHLDKANKDTFNWRCTFRKGHACKFKVVTILQKGEHKLQRIIAEHTHDPKASNKNNIYNAKSNGKNWNEMSELSDGLSTSSKVSEKYEDGFEMANTLDLSNKEIKENSLEKITDLKKGQCRTRR